MTEASGGAVRVVIVDDSSSIRAALRSLLDTVPMTDVIGEAADGLEGVDVVLELRPDVVVMDMQMPNLDGISAARQILEEWPGAQILMNSAYTDESLMAEADSYGVKGYLSKDLRPAKLVRAIVALGQLAQHDDAPLSTA
ncbi:MAG: response regulator transcription factor [Actinomycetota bacterium]